MSSCRGPPRYRVRQRYTRTLAGRWIIPAARPARSARSGRPPSADAQPLAGRQYQFQYRLRRPLLPTRAPLHQGEPHRPLLLEPFAPGVEGVLRQPLFLTELLHGHSAALLRSDSFGPLVCFRVGRLRLDDSVAHDTTTQRRPVRQEELFTRRLPKSGPNMTLAQPVASPGTPRIGAKIAEANLLEKTDPVYPPLALHARIQGTVEFTATIGTDGHIEKLQLVRGHPLLVNAAREAVLKWTHRPTLFNGKPVPIMTEVLVPFQLPH